MNMSDATGYLDCVYLMFIFYLLPTVLRMKCFLTTNLKYFQHYGALQTAGLSTP